MKHSPRERRAAALELILVLGADEGLRAFIHSNAAKATLPALPIVEQSWMLFLFSLAVLWWVWFRHRGRLDDFGLKPFRPWKRLVLIAVAGVFTAIVIGNITSPITAAYFGKPTLGRFAAIEHNLPLYLSLILFAFVFAGFGEEFLGRGFIMTRIALLFGSGKSAWAAALVIQAIVFGLGHHYQGISGMIDAGVYGLVFGTVFIVSGRNLAPGVLAHGLLDTLGFTLMYFGVLKV